MQGVHHKIHIGGARMFFSCIGGSGEGVVRAWQIIISGAILAPGCMAHFQGGLGLECFSNA